MKNCDTKHIFVTELPKRDGDEHRQKCYEWKELSPDERGEFFTNHGVRWSELARLPYFDIVRQSIIDPMHNLLLGKTVSQFFFLLN